MHVRNFLLPAFACLAAATLSACTDEAEPIDEPTLSTVESTTSSSAASASDTSSETPTNTSSEETTAEASPECGPADPQQALNANISRVRTHDIHGFTWSTRYAMLNTYNGCADLSAIVIRTNEAATSAGPHQVMLFHRGEYVGTATYDSYGFMPTTTRIDDRTIAVTWPYPLEGESLAMRSGEAHSTYTWNPHTESVDMTGEVPPRG